MMYSLPQAGYDADSLRSIERGLVLPDLCEAFEARKIGNPFAMCPLATYNITNGVIVLPLDPNGNYYGIGALYHESERERDETLIRDSSKDTEKLPPARMDVDG